MRRTVAGIAAMAAMLASAFAEPASQGTVYVIGQAPIRDGGRVTHRVAVDLSNLDMNKAENAPAVLERLKSAAEAVCAPVGGKIGVGLTGRIETCKTHALADAVASLNVPELTRLAAAQ